MALLAIVTVPVSLTVLSPFFHRPVSVLPGQVAGVITKGFLAPLLAGMVVGYVWPMLAERVGEPLIAAAGILLLVLVLLMVATNVPAIAGIGLPSFALIVAVTCAALAIGHVLGGPDPSDRDHPGPRQCDSVSGPRVAHRVAEHARRQADADCRRLPGGLHGDGDPLKALAQDPAPKPGRRPTRHGSSATRLRSTSGRSEARARERGDEQVRCE